MGLLVPILALASGAIAVRAAQREHPRTGAGLVGRAAAMAVGVLVTIAAVLALALIFLLCGVHWTRDTC